MSEDPWWKEELPEERAALAQERQDAANLIKTGNRTGDELTKRVGQARLRRLEGRATPEDLELLGKKT